MNGVYDRIRQLRIANGLTLEELARAVGYSDKSMMGHIEHGKVDLPLSRVAAIAQALHTTPQELLFPAAPPEKAAVAVTVAVKLDGMDEALDKARELARTIEKAKSLVGDLAVALDGLHTEESTP
uniref:helix-turn-helix domain-containing protein n=1 Tax=Gemmiger formicilis TaxID=745368 RepID=UPI0040257E63